MKSRRPVRRPLHLALLLPALLTLGPLHTHAQPGESPLTRAGTWPYGSSLALAVDAARHRVYLGSGGAVLIVDTQDVTNPVLLSEDIRTFGLVQDAAYDAVNQVLLLACGVGGLEIWDVQDPQGPTRLAIHYTSDYGFGTPVEHVVLSGHYAILGTDYGPGVILDVSDPANPVDVGGTYQSADLYISRDGLLHLVGYDGYFRFEVRSDGTLQPVGGYIEDPFSDHPFWVIAANDEAALIQRNSTLLVVKIPNDTFDPLYGALSGYANLYDMDVQGDHAYFAMPGELRVMDVSDPYNVHEVGSAPLSGASFVKAVGRYVYVAGRGTGLHIVDVGDPANPVEVGTFDTFDRTRAVAFKGDYAFVTEEYDGVAVLDEHDLGLPVLAARYEIPGITFDLALDGDLLYVAAYDGGLRIADVADPVNPTEIGTLAIPYTRLVAEANGTAYVIAGPPNQQDTLRVVDVHTPAAPVEIAVQPMPQDVSEIALGGSHLYAAAENAGLRVLDVSDPAHPTVVGALAGTNFRDVEVSGTHAYVASADWDGGALVIDVSDPTNPVLEGRYNPNGWFHPFHIAVSGNFAYASEPVSGDLVALWVGDPTNPAELGTYEPPGDMAGLVARDSLLFVADGTAGLLALHNTLYPVPAGSVTWDPVPVGTSQNLRCVDFLNQTTGWVVGDNGTILASSDGGNTWSPRTSGTSEDLFAVAFAEANTGWAGGRNGVLLHTTDGGQSWSPQSSGTGSQIRALSFASPQIGWAVGLSGTIRATTDGGAHWFAQTGGGSGTLMSVSSVDVLHAWIADDDVAGRILRTTDGGTTWQQVFAPTGADLAAVRFVDTDYGWAAGTDRSQQPYRDAVLRSTDGGVTWTESYGAFNGTYSSLNSIAAIGHASAWTVGGLGVYGQSFQTSDQGATWTPIYGASDEYLQSVDFVDLLHGWAVGAYGTIAKAISGYATGVPGPGPVDVVAGLPRIAGTPNPFRSSTAIAYEAPRGGPVRLEIYSVLGEKVRSLSDPGGEPGSRSIRWNGRDDRGAPVGAGVYFFVLRTGDGVQKGKVTRIR